MAGRISVGVLGAFMVAWMACALLWAGWAEAHTLPMSEVRYGIREAVLDQLQDRSLRVRVQGCYRIDRHAGQCVVRVYERGNRSLPMWCGVGWARLRGKANQLSAHGQLRPCPGRAPGPVLEGDDGPAA